MMFVDTGFALLAEQEFGGSEKMATSLSQFFHQEVSLCLLPLNLEGL